MFFGKQNVYKSIQFNKNHGVERVKKRSGDVAGYS